MSHLDLSFHCIPLPSSPTTTTPTTAVPSRPRARQVLNRLKRQASALVKSPTSRIRSASDSLPPTSTPPDPPTPPPNSLGSAHGPLASASPARSRSVSSVGDDDARSIATTTLHIDAPSPGDFVPYLPLATRIERESRIPYCLSGPINPDPASLAIFPPVPLSDKHPKRRLVPPSSPSPSERSDSTTSTRSPATPNFPHHIHHDNQYYTPLASALHRWSTGSDHHGQDVDPVAKAKAQIVRRSLIQDTFLLACAAAGDLPASPLSTSGDDGSHPPRKRLGAFKKKSTASLPPLKPPPSYPLPTPPSVMPSDDSDCSPPSLEKPRDAAALVSDEEWTLLLGAPSQPLEFARDAPTQETTAARGRSGSSPSIYSTKQHLSPEDIPLQVQQNNQPRVRTPSNLSTRSTATTRRIESGPAPNLPALPAAAGSVGNEDWTLSLPLLKKPKSSMCVDPTKNREPMVAVGARKCKSFAEWTSNLPDELYKLRELEREQKRERKSSMVPSEHSNLPQLSVSQASVKLKRQLPIGPGPSSPCTPTSPLFSTGMRLMPSKSMISLHSTTSIVSTCSHTSASGLRQEHPPFNPSPTCSPIPSLGATTFKSTGTISASTSVSTLGKFPLPPSFSSKLLQRRQAVPPMPKPLLPACAFASTPAASLSTSLELPISSAPATIPYFPSSAQKLKSKFKPRSRSKRKEEKENQKYSPPSTTSSASSSSSNSVRTVSSTATVIPNRSQKQRMIARVDELENDTVSSSHPSRSSHNEGLWLGGFDSPICEREYDTCTEGGFSVLENGDVGGNAQGGESEMDVMSIASESYYSARSSLSG